MKKIVIFLLTFFLIAPTAFASSPYVLPYPSSMPGGINYKLHLIWERVMQYWYFGDFGQFEYNLKESDKYLVESKTLFEYDQYLLGYNALEKSNQYFAHTLPYLEKAEVDGKNITDKRNLLSSAAEKHIETLEKLEEETPMDFIWTPEKDPSSTLHIHQLIDISIGLRRRDL